MRSNILMGWEPLPPASRNSSLIKSVHAVPSGTLKKEGCGLCCKYRNRRNIVAKRDRSSCKWCSRKGIAFIIFLMMGLLAACEGNSHIQLHIHNHKESYLHIPKLIYNNSKVPLLDARSNTPHKYLYCIIKQTTYSSAFSRK